MTWSCYQISLRKAYGSCFVQDEFLVWRRVKSLWSVASRPEVRIDDDCCFLRQENIETIHCLSRKAKFRSRWIWFFDVISGLSRSLQSLIICLYCLYSDFSEILRNVVICAWFSESERCNTAHIFDVIHEHFMPWPESKIFLNRQFRGGRSGN